VAWVAVLLPPRAHEARRRWALGVKVLLLLS
jgi:hypothetical protein